LPLLTLLVFSGLILTALLLAPERKLEWMGTATLAFVVGAVCLAFAWREQQPVGAFNRLPVQAQHATAGRLRVRWLLAGGILLLLLALNNGINDLPTELNFVHYHVQFLMFVAGVALVIVGLAGNDDARAARQGALGMDEWGLLLLIFVLALIPRVVSLDTLVRTLVDELPWVDGIRSFWWRQDFELLRPMSNTFPFTSLFPYIEAGAVEIFGRNLFGLRIASSITGALTVVALYGLARHLFDRWTALIAALLLAFFPPHVHFSRLALLNMVDPLPGVLALAWAARGLRHNRRLDWALAGAALGMTHYFFEAGRLLFTPLMVVWMGWLFVFNRPLLRARLRGIGIMATALLIVAAPMYMVFSLQSAALAGRLDQSRVDPALVLDVIAGNRPPEDLLNHVLTPFLMYINRPDVAAYYGGDQALVLTWLVPLLLLGALFVLLRPRHPAFVLLIWLGAVAVGNMLLKNPAVAARYVTALPALALLIAVGMREGVRLIEHAWQSRRVGVWLRRAVLVSLPVIAVLHMTYYFGPHMARFNVQNRELKLYGDGVDAILRAATLPANTHVFLIGEPPHDGNVPNHFLNFLREDMLVASMTPQEVSHRFLAELPADRPYAFFIAADDAFSLNLLNQYFLLTPAQITPYYADIPASRQYVLYYAPIGTSRVMAREKNPELQIFTPPAE
jgi:4-amino-4-deoxy-L-arabinose transferase-like glycosyltransferase